MAGLATGHTLMQTPTSLWPGPHGRGEGRLAEHAFCPRRLLYVQWECPVPTAISTGLSASSGPTLRRNSISCFRVPFRPCLPPARPASPSSHKVLAVTELAWCPCGQQCPVRLWGSSFVGSGLILSPFLTPLEAARLPVGLCPPTLACGSLYRSPAGLALSSRVEAA